MTKPNRPIASSRSRVALVAWLALAALVAGTGCLAPTTVSMDADPGVSESRAKRDLGIDYLASRRTAMAIRELTASMDLDPNDPQTHLWLGEAYRRKGQAERAEIYLSDAVSIAERQEDTQTEHEARLNLSALLAQMERYEESIEHCQLLASDPTFSTPWRPLTNCGWALMKLGRNEEARASLKEALDYFPRFGPALLNLGILESQEGHRLAAIRTLEKAIDSGRLGVSALAEANYRLGEIYVAIGRRDKAVDHFRTAVDQAPYVDWGSQSQAYLDLLR